MLRGFRRGAVVLLTGLMILSPLVAVATPMVASAAESNPQDQLERWLYYRGMRACFDDPDFDTRVAGIGDNNTVDASTINEGHIFTKFADAKGFGYLAPDMDDANDNDGSVSCSDGSIFVRGAKLFGFSNVMDLVCEMNSALSSSDNNRIKPSHPTVCRQSDKIEFDGGGGDVFQRALTKALETGGGKDRPPFNINDNNGSDYTYKALLYLVGKNSLEIFCGNKVSLAEGTKTGGSIDNDDIVSVDVVNVVEGKVTVDRSKPYPLANSDRTEGSTVNDVYYKQGGNTNNADDITCADMATMTRDYSNDYADWAGKHVDELEDNEDPGGSDNETGGTATFESTCALDGVGWIVCPIMTFIGKMNDAAFKFLESVLGIQPSVVMSASVNNAWSAFRDIANVAFVIAFMFIVYSQITSAGISNYGVKRMLPRIIIAAILVNISFYICAIAVDISNIVGSSIHGLLRDSIAADIGDSLLTTTWENQMGGILKGAAVGLGVIMLVVALFLAPTVLIAFAIIIMILVARQALVILLIVVAPLAFVAYLLPNTEDWFKKWYKAFIAVLMVYPIVGAVFGISTLAARVLIDVSQSGEDQQLLKVVALGVMAVPLFAVPAILKGSLAAAGSIGARISGLADKAQANAMKQGKTRADNTAFMRGRNFRKQAKQQFKENKFAEAVSGSDTSLIGRTRARAARGVTGRSWSNSGDYAMQNLATQAQITADKNYEDQVKAANLSQVGLTNAQVADMAATGKDASGRALTQHELAAANDRIMKTGSFVERRRALEYLAKTKNSGGEHDSASLRNRAVQGAYGRGDQNIYGVGFGNELVSKDGTIKSAEDMVAATQKNAADGKVTAEHLVQSAAATEYVTSAATGTVAKLNEKGEKVKDASGNVVYVPTVGGPSPDAVIKLRAAADDARKGHSTSTKVGPEISEILQNNVGSTP